MCYVNLHQRVSRGFDTLKICAAVTKEASREDGRWEGRIVVGHKEDGSSIFRYLSARTQKELLAKLHRSIESYRGVDFVEDSRMSLGEWLDRWLEEYAAASVRESTLSGYRRYVELYIKPRLGDKQVGKLTPEDVRQFYRELEERGRVSEHPELGYALSASTIRCIHGVLHRAMDAAVHERLIAADPTVGAALPKLTASPKQVLNDEQLVRFMSAIKADEVWYDFFHTELTTGLCRGEICGLMWSDFDATKGTLAVRRTVQQRKGGGLAVGEPKTNSGKRVITLPPSTARLLSERKKSSCSQWIFPNLLKPESLLNPSRAYARLKSLLENAGLPSLRFHDLRHTFATMSLEYGMDVKTLAAVIGHASVATTLDVYAHVTDGMRTAAAVSIDRGIAGNDAAPPPSKARRERTRTDFVAKKGQRRKPGTGCVSQINDNLWEGRYSPRVAGGKRMTRNVYAYSREECEVMLAGMIEEVKRELAERRAGKTA